MKIFSVAAVLFISSSFFLTRQKKTVIPHTGNHKVIHHQFDNGYRAGQLQNLVFTDKGLTVSGSIKHTGWLGDFLSEEIVTEFSARELVLTWNSDMPKGVWLHIQYRVKDDSADWSSWYDMAEWGYTTPSERKTKDPLYGPLMIDILKANRYFNRIQYRVGFYTSKVSAAPVLRMVTLCYSSPAEGNKAQFLMEAATGRNICLEVPWISQFSHADVENEAMIQAGVCAPTSLVMVMNYYGKPVRVSTISLLAFDPVSQIYGNWAFLAATAGNYGLRAWVQRFNNWRQVRRLIEKDTPVIISIAYPKGTFSHDPEHTSEGHLMVVRGFTRHGDIIVNDPGTFFRKKGESVIYKWQELGYAFFGHGGVGIVLER